MINLNYEIQHYEGTDTWTVIYVPTGEYLSHHETRWEALEAKARYIAADNRRACK